ncbi:MAG: PEP-CTERM sorting domain-containing protein [Verrucomicrobiaceae bacterium]|nr:MAG: PEP-CTERM sorting domain-containing protein [Verrucomicrobiaceae bacterium]
MMTGKLRIAVAFFALAVGQPAGAVIVGGTYGSGNNNATQTGLDAYLSTTTYAAFPYWNNLVRVGNASGVYLGYNPSTMRGWVLSANHITAPTSITVADNAYTVTGGTTRIGTSDLKLYEISGGPLLPSVPLASVFASNGEFALMLGRGFTNDTSAPYTWVAPGSDEANGARWGTNTIEGNYLLNFGTIEKPDLQSYLVVDFDGPNYPGVTDYDAQGAAGDSGGGLFIHRSGVWELSGIAHFVDDGPDFLEKPETGDGVTNPSQYGDFTAYADVHSYLSSITSVTGTLIPEPSHSALLAGAVLVFLARRRRH